MTVRAQASGTATGSIPVPRNSAELNALMFQRAELEGQLRSLAESQSRLIIQRQITSGDGNAAQAAQIDARIKEVSERIARIEGQKLAADDAISQALARGVTTSTDATPVPPIPPAPDVPLPGVPWPGFPDASLLTGQALQDAQRSMRNEYERLMILEGVVIVLLGALAWRFWFRRAVDRIRREMSGPQPAQRELKDAVDAIALEVERISENQRFVTKLMAEQPAERTAIRDPASP